MNSEQDLLNKLMISKKIMERHDNIKRGDINESRMTTPTVNDYQPVNGNYNIPQEYLSESQVKKSESPTPTRDRILNSNLPDEIKRLMIEYPIDQPNSMSGPTLSEDLVEKASRLMNKPTQNNKTSQQQNPVNNNYNDLKSVIRETVEDVLKENGLLIESTSKSNELFKFRVGQHIFEGKLTKIRKIQK